MFKLCAKQKKKKDKGPCLYNKIMNKVINLEL